MKTLVWLLLSPFLLFAWFLFMTFSIAGVLHALGHWAVGRLLGIPMTLTLGWGPRITQRVLSERLTLGLGAVPGAAAYADRPTLQALSGWRKLALFAGGPLASAAGATVLPFVLFALTGLVGLPGPPIPAACVGVSNPDSPAGLAGIRTDDCILSVDGKAIETRDELVAELGEANAAVVSVRRPSGDVVERTLTGLDGAQSPWGFEPIELFIGHVMAEGPAVEVGVMMGDHVVSVDGTAVSSFDAFTSLVGASMTDGVVRPVDLRVRRRGREQTFTVRPARVEWGESWRPMIGVVAARPLLSPGPARQLSLGEAASFASGRLWGLYKGVGERVFGSMSGEADLGGPVAVYTVTDWLTVSFYLQFLAVALMGRNLMLLVYNLLPLPFSDALRLLDEAVSSLFGFRLPLRVWTWICGGLFAVALGLSVLVVGMDAFSSF